MARMSEEAAERKRLDRIGKYGLCCKCKKKAISSGNGRLSCIARSKDQCMDCCIEERSESVTDTISTKKLRPPREGELQRFVDDLIARSDGVQDEVRRIARVQRHRRYIQKKAARDALGHKKKKKRRVGKSPTKEATAARIEAKRLKAIEAHGACKICERRPISSGQSPASQRAGLEEKCRVCYDRSHGMKTRYERGGAEYTSKLIQENGLCPKCEAHPISGGVSEISVLARDAGLCLYCYRATRTRSRSPRKKICRECLVSPVALGPSLLAVVARKKGLCLKCHRNSWKE